jgi:hypothetical protein
MIALFYVETDIFLTEVEWHTAISRHADIEIPVPSISFKAYWFFSDLDGTKWKANIINKDLQVLCTSEVDFHSVYFFTKCGFFLEYDPICLLQNEQVSIYLFDQVVNH